MQACGEEPKTVVCFGITVAVMVAATAFLALWYFRSVYPAGERDPDLAFCCANVLRRLWEASNTSVDPCRAFYEFTCYNWDLRHSVSASDKLMLQGAITPTYTGRTSSPAGEAIRRYYSACLVAFSGTDFGMDRAVAALLRALQPPVSPTPKQMMELLFRTNLQYHMFTGLMLRPSSPQRNYITLDISILNSFRWNTVDGRKRRELGLSGFNRVMSTNVRWDDLEKKASFLFLQDSCTCCTTANVSILASIFPTVALEDWDVALRTYLTLSLPDEVRYSSESCLKSYSNVVLEGNQPTSLALITVEASVRSWERLHRRYVKEEMMNEVCQPKAEALGLLWDIVVTESFAEAEKNELVRQLYKTLIEQVLLYLTPIFPASDVAIVREALSNYKLLLYTDLRLLETPLPAPSGDYWSERLAVKDYVALVRRHQAAHGIPNYQYGLFRQYVMQTLADALILPPSLYPTILLEASSEPVVNMPVVGPDVTEIIWSILVRDAERYSQRTQDIIESFELCQQQRDPYATDRFYLDQVLNASRSPDWHKVIDTWGDRRITRSQIFYMNYVFLSMCGRWGARGEPPSGYLHGVLSGIPDFVKTFNCPLPSNGKVFCSPGAAYERGRQNA